MAKTTTLEAKFKQYDKLRAEAKEAVDKKEDLATEIKGVLEAQKLDEVDGVEYTCLYQYEKDKDVFDEAKFAEKEPKKYADYLQFLEDIKRITKKYTKKAKGARKLIITRKNDGEE